MPSISDLYKGIFARLNIKTYNITTEDISDGKYCTTINFDEENSITIDTSAWNNKNEVIENTMSVQEEYDKFIKQICEEEYLETDYEEEIEI